MIGRLLGGRYAIIENVDSGGMAYIYKAVCKKTGSIVAVKVLKEEFTDNPEYVSRFKREAEAAVEESFLEQFDAATATKALETAF